ncbi:putative Integrator complex subunit 4-like protein [Naja naja]|nr:putative Integrator complex subunit 4-like protein [Naja naja]
MKKFQLKSPANQTQQICRSSCRSLQGHLTGRCIAIPASHLTDSSHGVRNKCLLLIGCLGTVEKAGGSKEVDRQSSKDVQKIIGDHFSDQDPRVRSAAIKAMLQLHERGLKLQQAIYNQACKLLMDDYEQVRSVAVQLTWVLKIRLVDDAFGKICHMVSDGSWVVRVQAAKLLGSMQQVSSHFLEQTLDKKLMSDLRVRIAAVEALCMLAQSSPSFAEKCLDFLVDMFNDEIEEVRLRSIHTMRKISNNITLREDQLDTVLGVLEDSSRDIREALHELLCCTNVSTREGIHLALAELLKNLAKYPTDRDSIWK